MVLLGLLSPSQQVRAAASDFLACASFDGGGLAGSMEVDPTLGVLRRFTFPTLIQRSIAIYLWWLTYVGEVSRCARPC